MKRGFTIIELLIVIAIIGILGGIIFTGARYLLGDHSEKEARAQIEVLSLALEDFKRRFGEFPATGGDAWEEANGARILLHSLHGTHEYDDRTQEWERLSEDQTYKSLLPLDKFRYAALESDADDSSSFDLMQADHYLVDPWGEPYVYQFPRMDGHEGFLLYSKGPDGRSAPFSESSASTQEKRPEDHDNVPANEPGKW